MRTKVSAIGVVLAVFLAVLVFRASVRGQEPVRPGLMDSLLVEVRALRGAIEQMVSVSARIQLATARLQIQEQRVNSLSRQLFEVRQSLAEAERLTTQNEQSLADLEQALQTTSEPDERQAIGERMRELKVMLSGGDLQRRRTEEADLALLVSTEQGRWTELNQQLDALDQALR